MCLLVPDDILRQAGITDREALTELACRLFDSQRLDKTAAARLCSLSRPDFEEELHKRGLAVYRTTAADYEQDRRSIDPNPARKAG
jgi:predicted HTH domain antitoxin